MNKLFPRFAGLIDSVVFAQKQDSVADEARAIAVGRFVAIRTIGSYGPERGVASTVVIGPHPPKMFLDRVTGPGNGWTSAPAEPAWDALTATGLSSRELFLIGLQFQLAIDSGAATDEAQGLLEDGVRQLLEAASKRQSEGR